MLLVCGKKSNMLTPDMLNVVFNQLVNVLGAEDDPSFLASIYKCFTDSTRVVGKESLPTSIYDSVIKATQNQLQVLAQKRKRRSEKSTRELQEERDDVALLEEMEDFAFEEMGKMLQLFDDSHPLIFAIGSLKDLGIRTEQWDNDGDWWDNRWLLLIFWLLGWFICSDMLCYGMLLGSIITDCYLSKVYWCSKGGVRLL